MEMMLLGSKFGLNFHEIARKTAEKLMAPLLKEPVADSPNAMFISLIAEPLAVEDLKAIRALEFFYFDPTQRCDLLIYSNILVRKFYLLGRIHCVSQILIAFPNSCITSLSQSERQEMNDHVLEHYGYLAIHECLNIESQWTSLYSQNPQHKK